MITVAKDAEQKLKDLSRWFDEGRAWVRHAANLLVASQEPPVGDLMAIIKHEEGMAGAPDVEVRGCDLPSHLTRADAPFSRLRIDRIENIEHVNALKPKKPLSFGKQGLTVIYGDNGAGKSGYTRILKHVCGARNVGRLHPDVRDPHLDEPVPKATIFYEIDGKEAQLRWSKGLLPTPPLSLTGIFDSDCGDVYVNKDHVLVYEPPVLRLFERLVSLAGEIDRDLIAERASMTPKKIAVPPEHFSTDVARWYQELSENTPADEIVTRVSWTLADEMRLTELKERLVSDPRIRVQTLRAQRSKLQEAMRLLRVLADAVSPEAVTAYRKLIADAAAKRVLATNHAAALSRDLPFEISSPIWRRLWELAREYSESIAYKGKPFPHTEERAHCVLCQQQLSSETATRLQSFEEYIKGKLEADALAAETAASEVREQIAAKSPGSFSEALDSILMAGGYQQEEQRNDLQSLASMLLERARSLLDGSVTPELAGAVLDLSALESLRDAASNLEERARVLDQDAKSENRKELVSDRAELEAKNWFSGFRAAIELEREALVSCHALSKAQKHTATRGLTDKKDELSAILISEAYISRFKTELTALGADRVQVEMVKGRPQKGVVPHELRLKGAIESPPTAEVLSEGERRVASLAAFLADMTGRNVEAPVIFDDPISSLDVNFEASVAKRLVALARDRQVIVFTHRVSLAWLLTDFCEDEGMKPQFLSVERTPGGCGNPEEPPFTKMNTKGRINELIGEIPKARKMLAEGRREYDRVALPLCVNIRKTLENIIEYDLLQGVVLRFRKGVQTDNRLGKLARIVPSDCKLMDQLMTKYSYELHDQSAETPRSFPEPDDIEADLRSLAKWRQELEARPKAF